MEKRSGEKMNEDARWMRGAKFLEGKCIEVIVIPYCRKATSSEVLGLDPSGTSSSIVT